MCRHFISKDTTMSKAMPSIVGTATFLLLLMISNSFCQEAGSERVRRQDSSDTAATVLSILPLDRLGSILGQIFSTGLKEMMNPDVGKKLVNVLESQAPLLITSMFTNLYTNLRGPVKAPSSNGTVPSSSAPVTSKPLSNSSSALVNALRQPRK